jgi:hypothetical protein
MAMMAEFIECTADDDAGIVISYDRACSRVVNPISVDRSTDGTVTVTL